MKTNSERQAAYRKRRQTAGDNGERLLTAWVSTGASLALARLARRYEVTQRAMIERLTLAADEEVQKGMAFDSPEWEKYFVTA